jgi:hypothetical protein
VSQIRFTGAKMAETKKHPEYGHVSVLQRSRALVQIETGDDSFWVTAASFTKKKAKPRAKKKKVVHKLDGPVIDTLLVRETRAEESEPEVFDEVEVVQEDAEEETEESCEEPITSGEDMAA